MQKKKIMQKHDPFIYRAPRSSSSFTFRVRRYVKWLNPVCISYPVIVVLFCVNGCIINGIFVAVQIHIQTLNSIVVFLNKYFVYSNASVMKSKENDLQFELNIDANIFANKKDFEGLNQNEIMIMGAFSKRNQHLNDKRREFFYYIHDSSPVQCWILNKGEMIQF